MAHGFRFPMTNFQEPNWTIDQSLRFQITNSSHLERTFLTQGNRKTWTFSCWTKGHVIDGGDNIFGAGPDANNFATVGNISGASKFQLLFKESAANEAHLVSTAVFRDISAWYHWVIECDTTQATAANRLKVYVNGVQITAWDTETYPSQNYETRVSSTTYHRIGASTNGVLSSFWDGYMAETHFIDGQALDASAFGELDQDGFWQPKDEDDIRKTVVDYGQNGFYLDFADTTSFGKDISTKVQETSTYTIDYSLRCDHSSYFSKTLGAASNQRTWTQSLWIKRSGLGNSGEGLQQHFVWGGIAGNQSAQRMDGDYFTFGNHHGGGDPTWDWSLEDSAKHRDPSSWMHLCYVMDTTATAEVDRVRFYINGIERTLVKHSSNGQTSSSGWPSLNFDGGINSAEAHEILRGGPSIGSTYIHSGYVADYVFIDGQALTPNNFGYFDQYGNWMPKDPSGLTFGTNGFHLDFADSSNLGKDVSGNGNNWTSNGFVASDQVYDSPTDSITVPDSPYPRGNYATCNRIRWPLGDTGSGNTMTEGNLKLTSGTTTSDTATGVSTIFLTSGKWYFEVKVDAGGGWNPQNFLIGPWSAAGTGNYVWYQPDGDKNLNGALSAYGATYGVGDTISCAFDVDGDSVEFFKNGVSQGVVNSGFTFNGDLIGTLTSINGGGGTASVGILNFGQKPWAYEPPTGYKAICSANMPTATIPDPTAHFQTSLWTNSGLDESVVQDQGRTTFKPDLVWFMTRDSAGGSYDHHTLTDNVRGVGSQIMTDLTNSESGNTVLSAFHDNGFGLAAGASQTALSGDDMVAWQWLADNTVGTSDSSGTLTVTRATNAAAGFSIVEGAGNSGSAVSFGHGLSTVDFGMFKTTDGAVEQWYIFSKAAREGLNEKVGHFDNAAWVAESTVFGEPTGTQFYLDGGGIMSGTKTWISYLWESIEGYSKFGKYTGNGTTDNAFVYTGFKPAYLMIVGTSALRSWRVFDNRRDLTNEGQYTLSPNGTGADATDAKVDFLSNGFKIRAAAQDVGEADEHLYMAFAEHPFTGIFNSQARAKGSTTGGKNSSFHALSLAATEQSNDVPTDDPVNDKGNYATFDPLNKRDSGMTLAEGNLKITASGDGDAVASTLGMPPNSGKYYCEITIEIAPNTTTGLGVRLGIVNFEDTAEFPGTNINGAAGFTYPNWFNGRPSAGTSGGIDSTGNGTYDTSVNQGGQLNDIVQIAYDSDTGNYWFGDDNTWLGGGSPAAGTSPQATLDNTKTWHFAATDSIGGARVTINTGQTAFTYTPPTDFKALATHNLPKPAIVDGSKHFNTVLYEGWGADTGDGVLFQTDFNGSDAATTATDVSANAHTINFNGSAQLDTAQKKWGTSSLLLGTSSDHINITDHADFTFGTGNFTFECWIRLNTFNTSQYLFEGGTDGNNFWALKLHNSTGLHVIVHTGASGSWIEQGDATGWAADTWYHVAWARKGGTDYLYRDGVELFNTTATNDTMIDPTSFYWGKANITDGSVAWDGWFDDIRVSSYCRYPDGTTFTPPTAAFPAPFGNHPITGVGFQPDLVWIKSRDTTTYEHELFDVVRGPDKSLESSSTSAEQVNATAWLQSFDSDGFTTGNGNAINNSEVASYVAWCWKANGAGVTNTDGSITSTVSANREAGFSIATFTGTGANATVGHGLDSAPEFFMIKNRDAATSWTGWHTGLTSANYTIYLDTTGAQGDQGALAWNSTAPSATVVSLGTQSGQNGSGNDHVMYCWHSVPGFSKFGTYEGNASTDGPFVYTGFKPAWIMFKNIDAATDPFDGWMILDSSRSTENPINGELLYASHTNTEAATDNIDFLSNGFKCRQGNNPGNSAHTYIYAAFAEQPSFTGDQHHSRRGQQARGR